ncbi:MAG: tetratricopeptide repeat protein [Actinomycetota bacterium]
MQNSFWSSYNLAKNLLENQQWQEAAIAYYHAIEINPDFPWSYYSLGEALFQIEQWEEAAVAYRRAIELNPDFFGSYHNLGDTLSKQEKWQEAAEFYRRAIELNPDFFWSNYNLAQSLLKLQRWEEATKFYRHAIEINPDFPWVYSHFGEALAQIGHWNEAATAYHRAIELNPEFAWNYYHLGEALLKIENWLGAATAYRQMIELNPEFPWAYYYLGEASFKLENWEEATSAYHQAFQFDPTLPEISAKLTKALLKRAQPALKAARNDENRTSLANSNEESLAHKALRLEPENPELYFQIANSLAREHQVENAIIFYQLASQSKSSHAEINLFPKKGDEENLAEPQPSDLRDQYLARVIAGKTFAEVGGLWGTANERVSVAHHYGAVSVTMIDITPLEAPLWQAFRSRIATLNLTHCHCISRDICQLQLSEIGTPYDVVHCAGVFYHHPHPMQVLVALRQITKEYLILTSAITPELVENEQGCYQIPASGVIFIPALSESERAILKADWEKCLLEFSNALGITEKVVFNINDCAPWWWLPTATALKSMCETVGFQVVDSGFTGHDHSLTLLLQVKS